MSQQINECEICHQKFNLFRRKKKCHFCGQDFCSKCISKTNRISVNNSRGCTICSTILNQQTTGEQLNQISTKHLRAYLVHSKIISTDCLQSTLEKQDLINIIQLKKRRLISDGFVLVSTNRGNNQAAEEEEQEEETTIIDVESLPPCQHIRANLEDISSFESISDLSVKQLKEILVRNFVSIKGCVEKSELITKVELLYRDHKKSKITDVSTENLCKICMDATIDCVFLDCGHLCTCVQCGKQLSECPLCRSYIVRVLRVFKS